MESTVAVEVNGIAGHICTVEAEGKWKIEQVQQSISQKLEVSAKSLVLLFGTDKLSPEATVGGLLTDPAAASLRLTLVFKQAAQGPVRFHGCCNGLEQPKPGHLRKSGGANGWSNATAMSTESFEVGVGRGIRFHPGQMDRGFLIGLFQGDPSRPDFAVYLYGGGSFDILEKGKWQFTSPRRYTATSDVEIRVTDKVEYFLDGQLEFTSALEGQESFFVVADFVSVGAEVQELHWL